MKAKHVFTTLALALTMGLGVTAGIISHSGTKQAKADTVTTMYLDTNNKAWYGEYSRAYLYKSDNTSVNNTWPGRPLEHVKNNLYKLDVTNISSYDSVIFLRCDNEVGEDEHVWNRTSKNGGTPIPLPSDWTIHNKFTFYEAWDGNEYDDGGYTGSWGLYTPPAVTYTVHVFVDGEAKADQEVGQGEMPEDPAGQFGKDFAGWFDNEGMTEGHEIDPATGITADCTVYGKFVARPTYTYTLDFSLGAIGTFSPANRRLYAYESDGRKNAEYPGVIISTGTDTITVPDDAKFVINDGKGEGTHQTVDITQTKVANDILYILSDTDGEGKYLTLWESEKDDPVKDETYYVVGTETDWKYAGSQEMSTDSPYIEDNTAVLFGYVAKAGEEIQVRGRFSGVDKWYGVSGEGTGNYVFGAAGTYDIFLNDSKELSAAAAVTRHTATLTSVKYAGKDLEGSVNGTQIIYEGSPFNPVFQQDGYILRGVYTNEGLTTPYTPASLTADTHLYAKFTKSCYYLAGDDAFLGTDHGWNVDYASPIAAGTGTNRLAGYVTIPEGTDEDHRVAVKPLLYTLVTAGVEDPNGEPGWKAEYYTLGGTPTFVELDGDGNFSFKAPGTYAFYVNNENEVWFNMGEYAFHAKFLSEVGAICGGIQGGTKTVNDLKAIWGNMEAAFNSLSTDDQNAIKAVGFEHGDAESSDERLQMIAKYHRIVTKYGTANFKDFIWNGTVASNSMRTISVANNTALVVILASAITVVGAAGLFFFIRRKKEIK